MCAVCCVQVVVIEGVDEPDAPQPRELEVQSVDLNLDTNRRVRGEG